MLCFPGFRAVLGWHAYLTIQPQLHKRASLESSVSTASCMASMCFKQRSGVERAALDEIALELASAKGVRGGSSEAALQDGPLCIFFPMALLGFLGSCSRRSVPLPSSGPSSGKGASRSPRSPPQPATVSGLGERVPAAKRSLERLSFGSGGDVPARFRRPAASWSCNGARGGFDASFPTIAAMFSISAETQHDGRIRHRALQAATRSASHTVTSTSFPG
mmetsp:Transcript_60238/g.135597  ORF Transcript_60238/g.135597 Transcript_60238/m.135597 type:complete len:220 (+) Transcript_60238:1667-2326(+)